MNPMVPMAIPNKRRLYSKMVVPFWTGRMKWTEVDSWSVMSHHDTQSDIMCVFSANHEWSSSCVASVWERINYVMFVIFVCCLMTGPWLHLEKRGWWVLVAMKRTLQVWLTVKECWEHQWFLINPSLCSPHKETKEQSGIQIQEIITITKECSRLCL